MTRPQATLAIDTDQGRQRPVRVNEFPHFFLVSASHSDFQIDEQGGARNRRLEIQGGLTKGMPWRNDQTSPLLGFADQHDPLLNFPAIGFAWGV